MAALHRPLLTSHLIATFRPERCVRVPVSIDFNEKKPVGRPRNDTRVARVSQPSWLSSSAMGGAGFVPRQTIHTSSNHLMSIEALLSIAAYEPARALMVLADTVPEVSKSVWNSLRLGCGKDAVVIRAMKKGKDGISIEEAPDGTDALKQLYASLPREVGTFTDALRQNFLMVDFTGMCAVEAVPGPRNTGVKEIWPLDTLTLKFKRDKVDKRLYLWQKVQASKDVPRTKRVYNGYQQLPPDRVFWSSLDGFPDNPYGRAPKAAVLMPVFEIMAFIKDLLLAWHRVGTPKWDIGFDYEMWAMIARDQLGLADKEEITKYIEEQFDEAIRKFESLQADDAFFHDVKSKVSVNGSGGAWPNINDPWGLLRWRLMMALHEMPTMMGVVEGSTETWSSVDWQVYAKGMESQVEKAATPLLGAGQLHLQLLGMPYTVDAEYAPIRANQRMVDAQSEQLEIDNEIKKELAGYQSHDEGSIHITGTKAVAELDKEALKLTPPPKNTDGKSPQGPSKGT